MVRDNRAEELLEDGDHVHLPGRGSRTVDARRQPGARAGRDASYGETPEQVWLQDTEDPVNLDLTFGSRRIVPTCTETRKRIEVRVRFNGAEKSNDCAIQHRERVLKWATGEQGFRFVACRSAQAHLVMPGADHPLIRVYT